jgi:molybdenum cofactor biosynthesis enzyme MoaA
MSDFARSYYCSMKFKFLKIDLESKTVYNCHAAKPHVVDFDWLYNNRGQIFNDSTNVQERQMMLDNQRNASCEQNCWRAEDIGSISPRLYQQGTEKTHTDIITTPEIIDLTIGSDCNLTCSYCSKEYSTAWRRDVVNNGNYEISGDRYCATNKDRVLLKISQPDLKETSHYRTLLNEIRLASPTLKKLVVTGGEPFLDNSLVEIIKDLPFNDNTEIEIYSGLGVSFTRFSNILKEISGLKHLTIVVSSECTDQLFEFNRYGSSWSDFLKKVELIKQVGINLKFNSTVTNLTVFGFSKFYQHFNQEKIMLTFAYQPTMMAPHVLDEHSKQLIADSIQNLPNEMQLKILKSINSTPTDQEKNELTIFLREFVKRRKNLSLTIFPDSFIKWLGIEHVV